MQTVQQIGCLSLPSISFPDPFVFDLSSYQVKGATQRRLGGLVTTYQVLIIHTSGMSVSLPTGGFEAFSKLANESSTGQDLALKKP